jgi:hypothetical protein
VTIEEKLLLRDTLAVNTEGGDRIEVAMSEITIAAVVVVVVETGETIGVPIGAADDAVIAGEVAVQTASRGSRILISKSGSAQSKRWIGRIARLRKLISPKIGSQTQRSSRASRACQKPNLGTYPQALTPSSHLAFYYN